MKRERSRIASIVLIMMAACSCGLVVGMGGGMIAAPMYAFFSRHEFLQSVDVSLPHFAVIGMIGGMIIGFICGAAIGLMFLFPHASRFYWTQSLIGLAAWLVVSRELFYDIEKLYPETYPLHHGDLVGIPFSIACSISVAYIIHHVGLPRVTR